MMRAGIFYLGLLATVIGWCEGITVNHRLCAQVDRSEEIQAEELRPAWRIGDRWIIETRSRSVQAGKENVAERGPAVQWQFTVRNREKLGGQECWQVEIVCLAPGRTGPVTRLWVDQGSMTLRQLRTQLLVAGTLRPITETYQFPEGQPSPVLASLTALPVDLPLFRGAQAKGVQSFVYEARPGAIGIKPVNDVGFAYEIEQQLSVAQPESARRLLDAEFAKSLKTKPFVDVHLKAAGRQVRQIWQAGLPWPSFAENGATEARLIRIIRAGE